MLRGLMMDEPLLVSSIIEYAGSWHPATEVVSRTPSGALHRYDYATALQRIRRCAAALSALGVAPSDRVTSLCWNTHQHFELFYSVPAIGAVLHTANPRLSDQHLLYILDHAQPSVLVFDDACAELVARLRPSIRSACRFVRIREPSSAGDPGGDTLDFEELLREVEPVQSFPRLDERQAAVLCYTSGTTGNPKGVLYSHRALVLIALASIAKDFFGGYGNGDMDTYMPVAGMFHATGWSFPYTAPLSGSRLVLPGRHHEPAALAELMVSENVTIAGAVPTVLQTLADWLEENGRTLPALRSILTSGSAPSARLVERWEERHGAQIVQTWGMTEALCSTRGTLRPGAAQLPADERLKLKLKSGRASWGTRLRIVDDSGRIVPHDGRQAGHLQARGPWVASGYYREEESPLTADGWLDTGDVATIDPEGYIEIRDRSKDVIKSGGEWISSSELEGHAMSCPGVRLAAVIAVPHERWQERPLLVIEPYPGTGPSDRELLEHIAARVVKWWLPERIERVAAMPVSATGKILKSELRLRFPA